MENDAISRSALLDRLSYYISHSIEPGQYAYKVAHREVETAPAIDAVPKWISIKERLPHDGQKIIMINEKSPSITLQGVYKEDKTPDTIRVLGFGIGKVTHWLPMPPAP